MKDKISGYVTVGINDIGEIVLNMGKLETDEEGNSYMVFSVNQAKNLVKIFQKKILEASKEVIK